MDTLSSKYTFFYKYIFIFTWIIGFGFGSREIIFFNSEFDARWIQYAGSWVGITVIIYFITGSIKEVKLNKKKKAFEVSNFLKTEDIAFEEIEDISGSTFLSPKMVWITLKNRSLFGRKILFMPAHRAAKGIGLHPIVMELRKQFNLDS